LNVRSVFSLRARRVCELPRRLNPVALAVATYGAEKKRRHKQEHSFFSRTALCVSSVHREQERKEKEKWDIFFLGDFSCVSLS